MFIVGGAEVLRSRGLLLVKVGPRATARVCLQSYEPEVVQTHWFGRQYMCPGWDCEACGVYASRVAVFQLVTVQIGPEVRPGVCELTANEWARCRMLAEMEGVALTPGRECELSRGGPRSSVRCVALDEVGAVMPGLTSRERLVDSLSLLFKLPLRGQEESATAWSSRVRPAVAAQLAGAIRLGG